jgi:hypothetical protein
MQSGGVFIGALLFLLALRAQHGKANVLPVFSLCNGGLQILALDVFGSMNDTLKFFSKSMFQYPKCQQVVRSSANRLFHTYDVFIEKLSLRVSVQVKG